MTGRILIVDDEPELLTALGRAMRAAGYAVTCAQGGEAALTEIGKERPDLVLCDVMMPGLNGFQTTRRIKGDAELAAIPVLLMSAKTDPADHFWAEEVGAECLLAKPLDQRALLERITALLGAKECA